jgi:alpha-glucosidase
MTARFHLRKLAVLWAGCSLLAFAQDRQIRLVHDSDVVEVQAFAPNIVRIHIEPGGKSSPPTLVIDPRLQPTGVDSVRVDSNGAAQTLNSPEMRVAVNDNPPFAIQVQDARGKTLVTVKSDPQPGRGQQRRGTVIIHDENENLYGIHGLDWHESDAGILRNLGGTVAAGFQGDGGAPFFFTRQYGVLVDSDGGSFQTVDDTIRFQRGSRPDTEYFVIVGPPMKTMAGLAALTGRPPMPPKWTLGFLNSQWGSTEEEWRKITETYEGKGIPVRGYILDYDWKAWGEDDYGERRWNSTSGDGNVSPNKFPNGASGKFAADMLV